MSIEDLKNKKIAILGLGEENIALTHFLAKLGLGFTVCDQKNGEDYLDNLKNFDIVFRTPGLPYLNPKIQKAKEAGVVISSETKLFFELCHCPIVGVTGTKGKGTTATLIAEILKNKSKVYLGGNIGTSPISFLKQLTNSDIIVLELSSFQLQDLGISPHIAVVLDIKVDHLDYHKSRQEYIDSKINIVKHQKENDFAVINADYLTSFEFGAQTAAKTFWFSRRKSVDEGCFIKKDEIILRIDDKDYFICKTDEVILRGEHNLENICAAILASKLAGAGIEEIIETVKSFKGLEHRLEFVRNYNGISYYNDSFSTTPDTTIAAINSFKEPLILLLGGSEKNADYTELGKVIKNSSTKVIISIGQTASKIIEAIGQNHKIKIIDSIKSMAEAVNLAKQLSSNKDVVILTPASASFDRYKNYKERGEIFKKEVLGL